VWQESGEFRVAHVPEGATLEGLYARLAAHELPFKVGNDAPVKMVAEYCHEQGVPIPRYLQVEGKDLQILRKASQSGRMPGVTFGFSPAGHYNGARISHMVSLVHADAKHFVILDNNYPKMYEWMSEQEFLAAYTDTGGYGWAVILLDPGPPPPPWNP
jgi:hypothetical protein